MNRQPKTPREIFKALFEEVNKDPDKKIYIIGKHKFNSDKLLEFLQTQITNEQVNISKAIDDQVEVNYQKSQIDLLRGKLKTLQTLQYQKLSDFKLTDLFPPDDKKKRLNAVSNLSLPKTKFVFRLVFIREFTRWFNI